MDIENNPSKKYMINDEVTEIAHSEFFKLTKEKEREKRLFYDLVPIIEEIHKIESGMITDKNGDTNPDKISVQEFGSYVNNIESLIKTEEGREIRDRINKVLDSSEGLADHLNEILLKHGK